MVLMFILAGLAEVVVAEAVMDVDDVSLEDVSCAEVVEAAWTTDVSEVNEAAVAT
jgi:hypothetical protein